MNAIIGYSEMLAEDADEQGLEQFVGDLKKITQASRVLLQLLDSVFQSTPTSSTAPHSPRR